MRSWIGILVMACNVAPSTPSPPPGQLSADIPAMFPGHTSAVFVTGADQGERVHYALSTTGTGSGPCPGVLGFQCLGIPSPTYLGSDLANENGEALLPVAVPATAPSGQQACFQAAIARGAGGVGSELATPICGLIETPDPCMVGTTDVQIGTGAGTFVPLVGGQILEMVRGGQGGWHMPLSVRAFGITDFVTLDINMIDTATGTSVSFADPQSLTLPLPPIPGSTSTCDGELVDIVAFLDFSDLGGIGGTAWNTLCGHEVRIDVLVRDYRGPGVTGPVLGGSSIYVIAQPDPVDGVHCTP